MYLLKFEIHSLELFIFQFRLFIMGNLNRTVVKLTRYVHNGSDLKIDI